MLNTKFRKTPSPLVHPKSWLFPFTFFTQILRWGGLWQMKTETTTFSYIARQKVVVVCVALSSFPVASCWQPNKRDISRWQQVWWTQETRPQKQWNCSLSESLHNYLETNSTHEETRVVCSEFCFRHSSNLNRRAIRRVRFIKWLEDWYGFLGPGKNWHGWLRNNVLYTNHFLESKKPFSERINWSFFCCLVAKLCQTLLRPHGP